MPPKKEFGKKEIINTAIKIVNKKGVKELSVRKIANIMGCSTTPIYSNFKSMKHLEEIVVSDIINRLIKFTEKLYTPNIFLNIGIGIVFFAKKYPKLYSLLFLNSTKYKKMLEKFHDATNQQMKFDQVTKYVSEADRKEILQKMWIFTHGLSTLASTGYLENQNDQYIIKLLSQTGGDVIGSTILQKNPDQFWKLYKNGEKK